MTILYAVTARGKHIAVVGSKEPILSGQYFLEENAHTVPEWDAVKSALPIDNLGMPRQARCISKLLI